MRIDGISLMTRGLRGPGAGADSCPQGIALMTFGFYLRTDAVQDKLADSTSRFSEPFDAGYYRWKYGRKVDKPVDKVAKQPQEIVEQPPEPERPDYMAELLEKDRRLAELEALAAQDREIQRDILELQVYIGEVESTIERNMAAQIAAKERENARAQARIEQLEANLVAARESLLLALRLQQRHRNRLAALEAIIRFYF